MINGVLYRVIPRTTNPDVNLIQYVVPAELKESLMEDLHTKCGHWSLGKMSELLKRSKYWVNMKSDLMDYVFGCETCGVAKGARKRTVPLTPLPFGSYTDKIHMDIFKPPCEGVGGYFYVLGIVDGFTKFVRLVLLRMKMALECAEQLIDK